MESGSLEQNRPLEPSQILSVEALRVMVLAAGQPWPKADGHWLCREGMTPHQCMFLLRSWTHCLAGEKDRETVCSCPRDCTDPSTVGTPCSTL